MSDITPRERWNALDKILKHPLPAQLIRYTSILGAIAIAGGATLVGIPPGLTFVAATIGGNLLSTLIDDVACGKDVSEDEIQRRAQEAIDKSDIENLLTKGDFIQGFGRLIQHLNQQEEVTKDILQELRRGFDTLATSEQVEELRELIDKRIPHESQFFDDKWFKTQVEASIADAEASRRYIPELNIELPVGILFDALGRTQKFFDRIFAFHKAIRKKHADLFRFSMPDDELKTELELVRERCTELMHILNGIEVTPAKLLPFDEIQKCCNDASVAITQTDLHIDGLIKKLDSSRPENVESNYHKPSERHRDLSYRLRELRFAIHDLQDFTESKEAVLSNHPAMLLTGDGGIGKTHLFCDVAAQRIDKGFPTILLLGEKFQKDEPWHQIVRLLKLNENIEISKYLAALNDSAMKHNTKVLLLIDALNEGHGTEIWLNHLGSFLHTVSQYPYIALAISVRSEYEPYIIPEGLIESGKLVREWHRGFTGLIDHAVRTYFSYYGIEYRVPPLQREFQIPLFLQTLCRGLQNSNMNYVPAGLQGFTQILDFFLDSVNKTLAKKLDYNPRKNPVRSAIISLVAEMSSKGSIFVQESRAEEIVNRELLNLSNQYTKSLYYNLITEGVLTITIYENESCVRFLYDRFTDLLIAQHFLDKYLDPSNPNEAFKPTHPLGNILAHKGNFALRYSLIPALAIRVPEATGLELFQVAPYVEEEYGFISAIVSSIVWRRWETKEIPKVLIDFINHNIVTNIQAHEGFLEAILGVAANPDNPFNADFLHKNLIRENMAERDAWWSIFLHRNYSRYANEQTSINRLINWARSDFNISSIDRESLRLMGITLSWFLSSSNRYLRDESTKALVSLFQENIPILIEAVGQFIEVNDPYILERLLAVAYGCAMRSNNSEQIAELAENVFKWIFSEELPPPDILLRDYARGVIEVALIKCVNVHIPLEKVRPPYKTDWITDPPSAEELKAKYGTYPDGLSDAERSIRRIHFSVMDWDFGTYIVDRVKEWTSIRLHDPLELSPKQRCNQFFKQLSPEKVELWNIYESSQRIIFTRFEPIINTIMDDWKEDSDIDEELFKTHFEQKLVETGFDEEREEKELNAHLQKFLDVLTPEERTQYEANVVPYQQNRFASDKANEVPEFDVKLAKRWIVQRVFDFGWTVERFGEFDHFIDNRSYGREAKKVERIGKKYQWIAYHEFLARLADNFHYKGDSWDDSPQQYEGTWQAWVRDIDPSFLDIKTYDNSLAPNWWFTVDYKAWDNYETTLEWTEATDDLPNVDNLIEVVQPENGSRFLNLEAMFDWEEPTPAIEDKYERPRHRLWYMLKSYLVKREDADQFFEWAETQDFMGRWMPESHDVHEIFLGEFFWSPAYRYHRREATGYQEWKQDKHHDMPCQICVTNDQYAHEDHYDCSIEETVRLNTPSKWLTEKIGLQWKAQEGIYQDQGNRFICFDPTTKAEGPRSLLINRDIFLQFLMDNNLEIIWTLLGEKMLVGDYTPYAWLKISGSYRYVNGKLVGTRRTQFERRTPD